MIYYQNRISFDIAYLYKNNNSFCGILISPEMVIKYIYFHLNYTIQIFDLYFHIDKYKNN